MSTPAEKLNGLTLENGWIVGNMIPKKPGHTGGHFSCSYEVRNTDGRDAFLKAMDYSAAMASPDPAAELNALTSAFLFEREVLEECAEKKMSRIVKAIEGGKTTVDGFLVEYLIFGEFSARVHDFAWAGLVG